MGSENLSTKLAAILYADVEAYSRLTELDEVGTYRRLRSHLDFISDCIRVNGGSVVHYAGDAVLADFSTVSDALRCATTIQETLALREASKPAERRVCFRIGVNLGEVIVEPGGEIYGNGVNVAARLESLADPGGLCVSESVKTAIGSKLALDFEFLGECEVKNISEPLRAYRAIFDTSIRRSSLAGDLQSATSQGKRPSIVVLPLICMADDRVLSFLADGLTEDLTTLLARIPGFFVISRSSAFSYKGRDAEVQQVARQLGVRYVVEGSVRPIGANVRVTAQLVDAKENKHLWAEKFDRPADRLFELQDEITHAVVARLEPELARAEWGRIRRRPPENLDAWDLYQSAASVISLKGWSDESFAEAAKLLRDAIAIDPDFALAHAMLSLVESICQELGTESLLNAESRVVASAERAIDLDGQNGTVLGYAGCALCDIGDLRRGIEVLERAVERDPSNPQAWAALGVARLRTGWPRKGIEHLSHGIQISPLDSRLAYWGSVLALALFRAGEVDKALEEARRACWRHDRFANSRLVLAVILTHQGRIDEAAKAMQEAKRIAPALEHDRIKRFVGRRGVAILTDAGLL